jgi:hypothetical protein
MNKDSLSLNGLGPNSITRINKKRIIVNKIELINIDFPKSLFR